MNEIAIPAAPSAVALPALNPSAGTVQLAQWAQELDAAHRLGMALAESSFLPMSLQKKGKDQWKTKDEMANDAAAVILAGKSVGMDPMQSVQNIFPVHGQPSMYARTMNALVLAQGHETRRVEATDSSVTWAVRRKGQKEWEEFTWTIDRAKKAGYTSNSKYQSDPIAMLSAKALAEACRTVFADILLGMPYSVEEMQLEDLGERPAAPKPTGLSKLREAAEVREEIPEAPPEEFLRTGELASQAQIDALVTALNTAGHTTTKQKADAIEAQLGVRKSSKELTAEEADILVQVFEAQGATDA